MLSILKSFFDQPAGHQGTVDTALLNQATDYLVEVVDPRLKSVLNYRRKLQPSLEVAIEYIIKLVDGLPEPVQLSSDRLASDKYVRALFGSPESLRERIGQDTSINRFINASAKPVTSQIHAALIVEMSRRKVMGMDLQGEIIRREVSQSVIAFDHHRFIAVSPGHDEMIKAARKRAFDNLLELALRNLASLKSSELNLSQQQQLLRQKLATLESADIGMYPSTADKTGKEPTVAELEQSLQSIEEELRRIRTNPLTLDHFLETIISTLGQPEECLSVDTVTVHIDRMNREVESTERADAIELSLPEVSVYNGRKGVVIPVVIPQHELPAKKDLLAEASRYL